MKLLLDIGNSRIKWGLRVPGEWRRSGAVANAEELGALDLAAQEAIAACVAGPERAAHIARTLKADLGIPLRFLETPPEGGGIRIAYSDPASLGVDRWLAMVGARLQVPGEALCVVDAGTALTLDLVAADGRHMGGYILPGLELMISSLKQATGDLDRLSRSGDAESPPDVSPAVNTSDAMEHGAVLAMAGAVDRARAQLDSMATVVLTGGDAEILLSQIPAPVLVQPSLVLDGMAGLDPC